MLLRQDVALIGGDEEQIGLDNVVSAKDDISNGALKTSPAG